MKLEDGFYWAIDKLFIHQAEVVRVSKNRVFDTTPYGVAYRRLSEFEFGSNPNQSNRQIQW